MDDTTAHNRIQETETSQKNSFLSGPSNDLIGQTIGDYKITKEIGRGGMAVVYEAHQISLDRDVAIKIIPQSLVEDAEYLERFKREASAAANLNHQNIVSIHGFGQFEKSYYYVMDLAKGKTLDKIIEEKKHELLKKARTFNVDDSLTVIENAGKALSYAHQHGVVHRDIKPSNLIVENETNRILITDFGLAKSTRWEKITPTASLFGTPAYMSPEQAAGKEVDKRSDIYSLGVVLYEMLTGALPYSGSNALEVIEKVKGDPLISPRSINPSIPLSVEYIILKAMSKNIKLRYNSMDDLLHDIANYKRGKDITTFVKIAQKKGGPQQSTMKIFRLVFVFVGLMILFLLAYVTFQYSKKQKEIQNVESKIQLAENYENIGMKNEAIEVYTEIKIKFPGTLYEKIAQERLSKLK